MFIEKLKTAGTSKITVTTTASTLSALLDAAAGGSSGLPAYINSLVIIPEDGNIRVLFDGNAPTVTQGLLINRGTFRRFLRVPLGVMRLISTSGSVACSVEVGITPNNGN